LGKKKYPLYLRDGRLGFEGLRKKILIRVGFGKLLEFIGFSK
jgi:hypothetical protein